jgi:hypothetical protein
VLGVRRRLQAQAADHEDTVFVQDIVCAVAGQGQPAPGHAAGHCLGGRSKCGGKGVLGKGHLVGLVLILLEQGLIQVHVAGIVLLIRLRRNVHLVVVLGVIFPG